MALFWQIVSSVLLVFLILLFARFVVDWVMVLARSWRPSGLVAAGLEVVYSTTDPPLKAVRKVIPPLNLGSIRLDLGFMVLLIAVVILRSITESARRQCDSTDPPGSAPQDGRGQPPPVRDRPCSRRPT